MGPLRSLEEVARVPISSKLRDRGIPKDRGWENLGDGDWWDGGGTHVGEGSAPGGDGVRAYYLRKEVLALVQS